MENNKKNIKFTKTVDSITRGRCKEKKKGARKRMIEERI